MESSKAETNRVPLSIIAGQITGWLWIGALIYFHVTQFERGEVYSKFWLFGYMLSGFQTAPGRGLLAFELCLLCECLFASALVMILARQNLGRIIANFIVPLILGLTIAPIFAANSFLPLGYHDNADNQAMQFMAFGFSSVVFVINCALWFFIIFVPLFLVFIALNSTPSRKWLKASLTVPPVLPQG